MVDDGRSLTTLTEELEARVESAILALEDLSVRNRVLSEENEALKAEVSSLQRSAKKLETMKAELASARGRVAQLNEIRDEARSRVKRLAQRLQILDADLGLRSSRDKKAAAADGSAGS